MKSIYSISILIFLELIIFPLYNFRDNNKILSRTTIHFLGILKSVYSTRDTLKNYNRFISIFIIGINYLFGKFLISHFYDHGCKYFDSMHSLIITFVTIIPFIFFTEKEDLKEFDKGGMVKNFIHSGLSDIISVNQLFYFYKHFHLKHGNIIEYSFNIDLLIHFVVDFLANSFSYVVNNLLCFFLTEKEKRNKKYLMNIFKKFVLMALANFAFYSIYSFQMARSVFEYINTTVPHPHNLILYNFLPKDLDKRFRLFLYIFNWLVLLI